MTNPREERPVHLSEVASDEDIDIAQATDDLERDPEEQRNATDSEQDDTMDHPG